MKQITDNIKAILALIIVISGMAYFYMCSIRNIKPDPQILIAIVASISGVTGFYYGSSQKRDEPVSTVQKAETVNVDQTVKP